MKSLRRRATRLTPFAVALLVLVGCASQAVVVVDEGSYRQAFDEFVGCMDSAGYPVIIHDDSGTVVDYSIPGAIVGTAAEEECYGPFRDVDIEWQVRNEDTSKGALAIRECLRERGIEPAGTAAGDWELVLENQLEGEC